MKIINSLRTTLFHTKSLVIGLLLCWLFPNNVWAYDAYVNGIYYNLDSQSLTASVTHDTGLNFYVGDIIIPESVSSGGKTYSVTSIDCDAFYDCTGLTSVSIPNSVTSIRINAFCNCPALTSVSIPNSVTYIEEYAFTSGGLTSINVDANNTTYDSRENCNAIIETSTNTLIAGCKNTVIPNSVTSIGNGAFGICTSLTSVNIPNSVTSIGEAAFYGCTGLTSVNIPSSVTSIGADAFHGCTGLTSVNIPNSVTSIGVLAFYYCTGLNSITVEWTTPLALDYDILGGVFEGVDKANCILYVPQGCISAYKSAEIWRDFENIQEKDPDTQLSDYDNIVYIESAEAVSSQQIRISLKMNNTIEATGFQCDVYLPDGVTAAQDEDGFYLMDISEERTTSRKTDYVSSVLLPDGGLRFMCSSTRSYTFSGNEGEVAYLMVDIDPSMEGGSYPLILKNIEISDANSNPYRVSYVKTTLTIHPYTLGDANNDGSIGVSDFTAIANYIMGMPPASFLMKAADVNADDVISVSDLTGVANIILYGTVSPNASHAKARNDVAGKYANIGAKDVVATTDKEFTVAVNIDGNYAYSGYQFDMTLPEGMTVKNVEGQTKASDVFMSGMIDDNTLRVLCASTMGETTESTVVNLTLVADVEGTYSIDIDNAIVSANASTHPLSRSSFLVGIGSDATGISTLGDESGSNAAVYDLTGKKLIGNGNMSSLQKGIYIVNGKKVTK